MTFRRKTPLVDAIQAQVALASGRPNWMLDSRVECVGTEGPRGRCIRIRVPGESDLYARDNDWIVRNPDGSFAVLRAEQFEKEYEWVP